MTAAGSSEPPTAATRAIELLEQLAQLLEEEFEALLQSHDAGRIEQLAAGKSALCAQIDALQPQAADDAARLQRVRALAQAVAQANQRNGAMLAALIRNTRGALDVLRGTDKSGAVYGPQGRTLDGTAAKPLGSA